MRHYARILIWENKRRLNKLREFRSLMIRYFNNSRVGLGGGRVEESAAKEARREINRLRGEIHSIILNSEINPSFSWTRPTAAGGDETEIDLIEDIFNLDQFDIGPNNVLGLIDRAIGEYESNRRSAFVRTINPFFYLGRVLDTISDLPFIVIGILGFNRQKIKASVVGRLVKGILYLIIIVAAILTILHLLGFLEPIKQFVHKLLVVIREINSVLDADNSR
ncbi:hypothetical protein C6502_07755 [Candidatus Poribacteria bacterium]|nr:MAG: hypothetical protein C6502_07755 [Candidatus Poribacteria bacterium]